MFYTFFSKIFFFSNCPIWRQKGKSGNMLYSSQIARSDVKNGEFTWNTDEELRLHVEYKTTDEELRLHVEYKTTDEELRLHVEYKTTDEELRLHVEFGRFKHIFLSILATFWLILLMRFWQIIFLKGQMTSDRAEIFFFITNQILLHNFYWSDFIFNDFKAFFSLTVFLDFFLDFFWFFFFFFSDRMRT